ADAAVWHAAYDVCAQGGHVSFLLLPRTDAPSVVLLQAHESMLDAIEHIPTSCVASGVDATYHRHLGLRKHQRAKNTRWVAYITTRDPRHELEPDRGEALRDGVRVGPRASRSVIRRPHPRDQRKGMF